jgi:hypothetical protein
MVNLKAFANCENQNNFAPILSKNHAQYNGAAIPQRIAAVSAQEFSRQRAVDVAIGGRYSLANWYDPQGNRREYACRTSRVSPFRMMVSVPVVGKVGDRVTSYFGDFGTLDGVISDTVGGGFLLELAITKGKREQLASKLTWLERQQKDPTIRDVRAQSRIVPANPHSSLLLADGTTRGCFVIDYSLCGAAVSADLQPKIGTPLAIGACIGRVVRLFRHGFAVKFVEPQKRLNIERLIARPAASLPRRDASP